ncbi:MAG: hypothetical protein H7338_21955 [Candidatus Sericytochromatia bacterium]|nr:hypothetical protein [Candidatus Sericytochromatia bacterium]
MPLRSKTLLLTLVLACGTSCQMPHVRSAALLPGVSATPVAGSANVRVRIGAPGLSVQALPKTFADVATVLVTLKSGVTTVVSPTLVNPMTITLPILTGTFTGVPPGTGYTIEVVAFDPTGAAITSGMTDPSGVRTVAIAGGVATYSAGTELIKGISLSVGTASTDASSSLLTNATVAGVTFDRYKWMLINNDSKQTANSPLKTTNGIAQDMNTVQPGAKTGPTHELWLFSGQDTPKKALPVQRFAGAANAAGAVQAPFNATMAAVTLTTPTTSAVTPVASLPMTVDDVANVYYVGAANAVIKLDATNSYAASTLFTAGGAPTGFVTDGAGNVYYSTGTDIKVRRPPLYDTDTTLITTTGVTLLAVDEFKDLLWIEAGAIAYSTLQGGTYQAKQTMPSVTGTTMLATDAFGNAFVSNGTNISRQKRNGEYFVWEASFGGPPTLTTCVTANNISGFTADRAGNLYFTQTGSNEIKLVPSGGPTTDHFTVAGNGPADPVGTTGVTSLTGAPLDLAVTDFRLPVQPAVTSRGVLFCTSIGADGGGLTQYLRRIMP